MLIRSFLTTSALKPYQFSKLSRLEADLSIVDLEDSVPPGEKEVARQAISLFFEAPVPAGMLRGIRVNSLHSEHGIRDMLFLIDNQIRPDILVIPKVESKEDLGILDDILGEHFSEINYLAIIETARGLTHVNEIAASSPNLKGLIFGAADFSSEVGIPRTWDALVHARWQIVLAAVEAGILALDTPCFELSDMALLRDETERVKELGYTGKLTIHPSHLGIINEVFTPGEAEIEKARRIIEISERNEGRICVLDDMMIGPPLVERARRVQAIADKLAQKTAGMI